VNVFAPGANTIVGTGDVCALATAIAERNEQCADEVGGWVVQGVVVVVSVVTSTVIVVNVVAAATGAAVNPIAGNANNVASTTMNQRDPARDSRELMALPDLESEPRSPADVA
jgi:hypothetical protein